MPPRATISNAELRDLLLCLAIDAAPFAHGRGMERQRKRLLDSVTNAARALRLKPEDDGPQPDADPALLRQLAAEADAAMRAAPGFRADLEG